MTEQRTDESSRTGTDIADDEIDLARLVGILVDHSKAIVLVTVLAVMIGVGYLFAVDPVYRADALLQVEQRETGIPGLSEEMDNLFGKADPTAAEIEIIRSRMVLGSVVDELQLDLLVDPEPVSIARFWHHLGDPERLAEAVRGIRPADNGVISAGWGERGRTLRISSFRVPDELLGEDEEWVLRVLAPDHVQLWLDDSLVLEGAPGATLASADGAVELRLLQMDAAPGAEFRIVRLARMEAIDRLREALGVTERGKESGMLYLTLNGDHLGRIREALAAIARTYLLQNIERRSAEAAKSLTFLEEQTPRIRKDLDGAEKALNQYRTRSESVDLSLETQAVLDKGVEIDTKLSELALKESELGRLYTRQHPNYRALLQQRGSLEAERKQLEKQVQNLPHTQQEILRLTRDVETNQAIYLQLLNRAQELEILKAGTVGNVRIIDSAQVAPEPVAPRPALVLALAALLGAMASVAGVFVAGALKQTLESPEQLEQEGIPVYAALPLSSAQERLVQQQDGRRGRRASGHADRRPLLAHSHPGDLAVEALRSLRTSLHFAMLGADNRVVMITGASPGVGKSFVTANLGVVLAQAGKRVVVVDGDLRRGHLHSYFGIAGQPGLSNYLAGDQAAVPKLVRRTAVPGLDMVPRGEAPPNPSELLLQPRLKAMLAKLGENYDYVLIDSPPVLAVTDAAIIGNAAGTTLLVARFGVNTLREMDLCRRRLARNGVMVRGAIFNALERRAANTYGYYAYYQYRYGEASGTVRQGKADAPDQTVAAGAAGPQSEPDTKAS